MLKLSKHGEQVFFLLNWNSELDHLTSAKSLCDTCQLFFLGDEGLTISCYFSSR